MEAAHEGTTADSRTERHSLDERIERIAERGRLLRDVGRDSLAEAARLARDLLRERPVLAIGAAAAAAFVVARFGLLRTVSTAAKLGGQAAVLTEATKV